MSEPRSGLDYPYEMGPRELEELARRVTIKGRGVRRRRRVLTVTGTLAVLIVAAAGVSSQVRGTDRPATSSLAASPAVAGSTEAPAAPSQHLAEPQRAQSKSYTAGVFTGDTTPAPTLFVGATGAGAEQQTVYNSATGAKLRTLGRSSQRLGVLSGDRTTLYVPMSSCGGYVAVAIATGKSMPAWGGLTGLRAALPSPDGTHLVYDTCAQRSSETTLVVRDLTTGTTASSTIAGNLYPESWSPDQTRIAVSNRPAKGDESVLLLDAATLQTEGAPILDSVSRCVLASPQLVSSTAFIAVEDCTGGAVNLVRLTDNGSGPAKVAGLSGVYSDPSGSGPARSTMSLDSAREHALVQISRSASQPTAQNGLVFTVDAGGVTQSKVSDTYQVLW